MSSMQSHSHLPDVFKIYKKSDQTFQNPKSEKEATVARCPVKDYLTKRETKPPRCDNSFYYFHGKIIADPFRPFEHIPYHSEEQTSDTQIWIQYQKTLLEQFIGLDCDREQKFNEIQKSFRSGFSSSSMIGDYFFPVKGGALYRPAVYGDSINKESQIRVRLASFRIFASEPHLFSLQKECLHTKKKLTLFDEKDFHTEHGKAKIKSVHIHPTAKVALVYFYLSPGSKFCIRLIDTETGSILEECPEASHDFTFEAWHPIKSGYYYSKSPQSIYFKDLYYHETGTILAFDPVVVKHYSSDSFSINTYWSFGVSNLSGRSLIIREHNKHIGFPLRQFYTHPDFPERLIEIPVLINDGDAPFGIDDHYLYAVRHCDFQKRQIVKYSLNDLRAKEPQIIISALEMDDSCPAFFLNNHILTLEISRLEYVLRAYNPEGHKVSEYKPRTPSKLSVLCVDYHDFAIDFGASNFIHHSQVLRLDVKNFRVTTVFKSRKLRGSGNIILSREMALSHDGVSIPITLIHRKDVVMDGTAPTILWGYGGFGMCSLPEYDAYISYWVQRGGIYAVAHLRGDGGWDPGWAYGGARHLKPNTFYDYICCAEHLINSGKTKAERLIAMGASNGGLTVVASMQKRPDLFACVVSLIPILDMFNMCIGRDYYYSTGWLKDYGNPMIPEDFDVISRYSPLQNIEKNSTYPPCLIMTLRQDTTAHPAHSLKFVAAMQELNPESSCFLYWKDKGGHGDLFRDEAAGADYDAYTAMTVFIEAALRKKAMRPVKPPSSRRRSQSRCR